MEPKPAPDRAPAARLRDRLPITERRLECRDTTQPGRLRVAAARYARTRNVDAFSSGSTTRLGSAEPDPS